MQEMSEREKSLRAKHRKDFLYYAPRALWIRTKNGTVAPLQLNAAQKYLHERLEEQLRATGKVRALIVKGRQQGCSTYVEGRFFWRSTHRKGMKTFILTHLDDATKNLFGMAKRFYDHVPAALRPTTQASNAKELLFDQLDSGYKVATAGSIGVGRSDTLQYFHGSEVAYWPNADTHVAGALQAVPDEPGTEVILESTSNGPSGLFYELCKEAMAGQGEYQLIFIPWFWQQEYRKPVPRGFKPTSEEEKYRRTHGLDLGQIVWRRVKIVELHGVHHFRREYPATPEEAFKAETEGALWRRELIDGTRWFGKLPPFRRIVVGVDPSGGDGPKNDEVGIVAGGLTYSGHVIILSDVSGKMLPNSWGYRTVAQYKKWKADRIVGEKNYGGAMVEHVIRTVDPKVSYKGVDATRGKKVRAEPIQSLYEQGLVHHCEEFIALEDEMCTWVDDKKHKSPNRLDAMVWVVTELLLGGKLPASVKPRVVPAGSPYPQ